MPAHEEAGELMSDLLGVKSALGLTPDHALLQVVADRVYLAAYAEYHGLGSLEAASLDLVRRLALVFGLQNTAITALHHEPLDEQGKMPSQTSIFA